MNLIVAALQSASLPYDKAKLEYFLTIAKSKGAHAVILGEYVVSLFFKELLQTPLSMIEEQARQQYDNLLTLSKTYNLTLIAPLVLVKRNKPYKAIVRFTGGKSYEYLQQILIPYPHWDEASFFANSQKGLKTPPIFRLGGLKIALLSGFETHFDPFWNEFSKQDVDAVFVPTLATFDSNTRWKELLKMRAFTHNMYVLRVNRVGQFHDHAHPWHFYGDTFLATPDGEIEGNLGNSEEILMVTLEKRRVQESRKAWQFNALINARKDENGKLF